MKRKLTTLLEEVVRRRCPEIAASDLHVSSRFSKATRFRIRQALTDEFCDTGLNNDDEPNQRGLLLEELIDYNDIQNPNLLALGQEIRIPPLEAQDEPAQSPTPTVTPVISDPTPTTVPVATATPLEEATSTPELQPTPTVPVTSTSSRWGTTRGACSR